jgi:hypothetical protein
MPEMEGVHEQPIQPHLTGFPSLAHPARRSAVCESVQRMLDSHTEDVSWYPAKCGLPAASAGTEFLRRLAFCLRFAAAA